MYELWLPTIHAMHVNHNWSMVVVTDAHVEIKQCY